MVGRPCVGSSASAGIGLAHGLALGMSTGQLGRARSSSASCLTSQAQARVDSAHAWLVKRIDLP